MLCAVDRAAAASREIVLSGSKGRSDFEALRETVFAGGSLNRVVAHADEEASLAGLSPLVEGRGPDGGPARAFVCENFACRLPIVDPAELAATLHG
jgi:uncharacterized protein YyaL (SSP411 family)